MKYIQFFLYWAVINISGVSKLTWPKTYLVLLHFYLKYDWMLRTCLASLYPWSSCLVRSAHLDTTFSHLCVTDANRFLIRITSCFWLKYFRCVPAQETKPQVTFSLHFVFFRIVLNNIIFVSRICVVIKEIIFWANEPYLPPKNEWLHKIAVVTWSCGTGADVWLKAVFWSTEKLEQPWPSY